MKKNILLFLLFIIIAGFSVNTFADTVVEKTIIEPRASSVFISYGSLIQPLYYGGDCELFDDASGSLQIILQKQNDYNKVWYTYDGQKFSKAFSNTSLWIYEKKYILPVGKFRSKTIATATLNGVTETRTVYSPELTIYSAD